MWSWICCYLMGHDYGICCELGSIYLRCSVCGRRSHGWNLRHDADSQAAAHPPHAGETKIRVA